MDNQELQAAPSYWISVLIGALVAAIIVFVTGLIGSYSTLGSEPSGSLFNMFQLVGILSCLLSSVGGVIAVRHYAKEYEITFKIGKGALIGLFTAIGIVAFSFILNYIWGQFIDPSMEEAIIDWNIKNIDLMQIPDANKEAAYDQIENAFSAQAIALQTGISLVTLSIVNVISGIIAAKIFA